MRRLQQYLEQSARLIAASVSRTSFRVKPIAPAPSHPCWSGRDLLVQLKPPSVDYPACPWVLRTPVPRGHDPRHLPNKLLKTSLNSYVIGERAGGKVAMAYVPGFEWDIFISYPRESDERDARDFQWVQEFRRLLESEIRQRLPESDALKIYFDRAEFGAADHLKHDLLPAARSSALFLPITSPLYFDTRKFTMQELREFCASGNSVGRIVIIELLPVPSEERPSELNGPKRNHFFVMEQGKPIRLTPQSSKYADTYVERLQFVAEDIKEVLQEMGPNRGGRASGRPGDFEDRTVVLAEKEEGVDTEWEQIRIFLRKELGVRVLPNGEYPANDAELPAALKLDLARSDLFIQLLSPEDEAIHARRNSNSTSRGQTQSELAHAHLPHPERQILQWRKPILTRPEALASWNKALLEGPHVLVGTSKEFKDASVQKLRQLIEPATPPLSKKSYSSILHARTWMSGTSCCNARARNVLDGHPSWIVKRCPLEGKPEELQEALDENLMHCEALWLVYGHSSSTWVDKQLMRCFKLTPNRKAPLAPERKAIVLVPPPRSRDIPWVVKG